MTIELTILMPCLNEANSLAICIKRAQSFLAESGVNGEVLIADNGSTDGSQQIATDLGARLIHVPERGYGAALKAGIEAAYGTYVIMGDADDSYRFDEIADMVAKLQQGEVDLVMGNRFAGGIEKGAMPFWNRYLGNPVLSFIGRLFFKTGVADFHCGMRGFNREKLLSLNLHTSGMEYASEMVVSASLRKMRVAEVPVKLYCDKRGRAPHLKPWRDGWRHLCFLLVYSPRWLYIYPSLFLLLMGLGTFSVLLIGPLKLNPHVTLDTHTLLIAAMAVITGLQGLSFGVLARLHAMSENLYPTKLFSQKIMALISLERVLVSALVFIISGLAIVIYQLLGWSESNFGPIYYGGVMRTLIAAMTLIVCGIQLAFSGFMLSVLKTKKP